MKACETCGGSGEVWHDACDSRGEHITRHEPCPDCDDGTTELREADAIEDAELWRSMQ